MLTSIFAEDLIEKFYEFVYDKNLSIQSQDHAPLESFYLKIINKEQLTNNQANFAIKLLEKYRSLATTAGFHYSADLTTIKWKQPFRVLDLSKKIYAEKDEAGKAWVCLKFPYQLKKQFDDEIEHGVDHYKKSFWDSDLKVRRLSLYDYNLIQLYEFAVRHAFEIDESFMLAVGEVEEIWQNSKDITPYSTSSSNTVFLHNASDDVRQYWDSKVIGTYEDNVLLAKNMGYIFDQLPKNTVEKIAASTENSFWIKHNQDLFDIYKTITGKICVILDRTGNTLVWLQRFVADADQAGVDRDEIKVCFRENKENNSGVNDWIKAAGVGGKVETGRILIFEYKPAKWLFKQVDDVKMLVTNNLYPPTNQLAKDWFTAHPCVIYLGDIKPSEQRGQKIVEL
jgi:hypothetical protein